MALKLGVALEVRTLLHTDMMEKNPLSLRMYLHRRKHRLDSIYPDRQEGSICRNNLHKGPVNIHRKTRYLSYCIIE